MQRPARRVEAERFIPLCLRGRVSGLESFFMCDSTCRGLFVCVAVLCGTEFGQSRQDYDAGPITVCEVLRDARKYNGKNLAVLGRLDCGHGLIDNPCVLVEDRCEWPVATEGKVWPKEVAIVPWERGVPMPPKVFPRIDPAALIEKLSLVRSTTKLGLHKEPQFKTEGRTIVFSHFADVKDQWGIAYGRVVSAKAGWIGKRRDEAICGGFGGARVALIVGQDVRRFSDGAYPGN